MIFKCWQLGKVLIFYPFSVLQEDRFLKFQNMFRLGACNYQDKVHVTIYLYTHIDLVTCNYNGFFPHQSLPWMMRSLAMGTMTYSSLYL